MLAKKKVMQSSNVCSASGLNKITPALSGNFRSRIKTKHFKRFLLHFLYYLMTVYQSVFDDIQITSDHILLMKNAMWPLRRQTRMMPARFM